MPFGSHVVRERRRELPNPANPDRPRLADWSDNPDRIDVDGFVSSVSSSSPLDPARSQVDTTLALYATDPFADVLPGDRIIYATGIGYVRTMPAADRNPWTGWQPYKEIRLYETEG